MPNLRKKTPIDASQQTPIDASQQTPLDCLCERLSIDAKKHGVEIYARVLLPGHIHLICIAEFPDCISAMMQGIDADIGARISAQLKI